MPPDLADTRRPPAHAPAPDLARAIGRALDELLRALDLEPVGEDRFRATNDASGFPQLFGGQLVAQALAAAGRTTEHDRPHALHAHFVAAGSVAHPVELDVDRVRDGRSLAVRRITLRQAERTLLIATASFHSGPVVPVHADPPDPAGSPESLPLLQSWVDRLPPDERANGAVWIEHPPPLELRLDEPLTLLGGARSDAPRTYWLRLPRDVGDDVCLQSALLAHASDYFLTDAGLRRQPEAIGEPPFFGMSLDHALWLHRPPRLHRWHRYTQRAQAIAGELTLVRGLLHDAEGRLVASVMQENLIRTGP